MRLTGKLGLPLPVDSVGRRRIGGELGELGMHLPAWQSHERANQRTPSVSACPAAPCAIAYT